MTLDKFFFISVNIQCRVTALMSWNLTLFLFMLEVGTKYATNSFALFFSWKSRFLLAWVCLLNVCFLIVCLDEMKRRRDFYAEHPVDGKYLILKSLVKKCCFSLIYCSTRAGTFLQFTCDSVFFFFNTIVTLLSFGFIFTLLLIFRYSL